MERGSKTGSVGKGLPSSMLGGTKKPTMGFPLKGRKPFVPPQKIMECKNESDNETGLKDDSSGDERRKRSLKKVEQITMARQKEMQMRNGLFGMGQGGTSTINMTNTYAIKPPPKKV